MGRGLGRLKDVRRLELVRIDANTNEDVRAIDEKAYALRFQRSDGPYRLVSIRRLPERDTKARTASLPDFEKVLKMGMTMGDALPLLQQDGSGRFAFATRDRFHARVRTSTGDIVLVYFQRPTNVPRPEVVATASPEVLRMSGSMPLHTLPEFTEYRLAELKKEK